MRPVLPPRRTSLIRTTLPCGRGDPRYGVSAGSPTGSSHGPSKRSSRSPATNRSPGSWGGSSSAACALGSVLEAHDSGASSAGSSSRCTETEGGGSSPSIGGSGAPKPALGGRANGVSGSCVFGASLGKGAPHSEQNLAAGGFSAPQLAHAFCEAT